jgi:hypothetical protein
MDDYESLSHSKWECKYHVVFIPKCRRKTLYVELRRHFGGGVPKVGAAKRKQDRGRPSSGRSRAHVDFDPTEVCRVAGDWVYQRKERDPLGSRLWREEAEFCRSALLGERILCIYSWTGHRGDTRVHQEARGRGPAPRADESVALIGHLQVANSNRGRVSDPHSRFERLTNPKPPALPGDTYASLHATELVGSGLGGASSRDLWRGSQVRAVGRQCGSRDALY